MDGNITTYHPEGQRIVEILERFELSPEDMRGAAFGVQEVAAAAVEISQCDYKKEGISKSDGFYMTQCEGCDMKDYCGPYQRLERGLRELAVGCVYNSAQETANRGSSQK